LTVLAAAVTGEGLLDRSRPTIPLDQDLFFGRAARETVRLYDGVAFKADAKLDRLARSARSLGLPPVDMKGVRGLFDQVAESVPGDALVRLYWTSAQGPGENALDRSESSGRAIVIAMPIPDHLESLRRRGIRLVSLTSGTDAHVRAESPWLIPGAKASGSAPASAAWSEAQRRGADDAVLVDLHGRVLEGPGTNIWWRRGRTLFSPSLKLGILPGITRATVIELAPGLDYQVREGVFPLRELAESDEAFVTSAPAEVMGAVDLDGRAIGAGSVGRATRELHGALQSLARGAGD
jgi:branched-subunit amino acid aminotransferase/4-amino-4-deoxychorismate lyase